MNGIIHNCTHGPNDLYERLTEEQMYANIFKYIDKLVNIARPQKILYMAIDGMISPPRRQAHAVLTRWSWLTLMVLLACRCGPSSQDESAAAAPISISPGGSGGDGA